MIPIKRKDKLSYWQFLKVAGDKNTVNLKSEWDMFRYKIDNTNRLQRQQMDRQKKIDRFRILWIIFLLFGIIILIGTIYSKNANATLRNDLNRDRDTLTMTWNLSTQLNNWQAITIYWKQLEEMKARWYSNTRILDLLTIKSLECNSYTSCVWFNANDIWPFQINKIHKEEYNQSFLYHNSKDYGSLFLYQLTYANKLVQSYEDRFCGEHIFKEIGKKYTNEARFKCVAVSYNWHPKHKYAYKLNGWAKRQVISEYLFDNWFLINN